MAVSMRNKRLFTAAVFFAFGAVSGVLTARYVSVSVAASVSDAIKGFFDASTLGASVLAALAVPILMLLLSMTLFGAFLILPCVMLAGGFSGWALYCLLRCGIPPVPMRLLLFAALVPQIICLLYTAASCMRLSASLRRMAAGGGLRKPDISAEFRMLAVSLFILLLTAVLFSMLLKRWPLI